MYFKFLNLFAAITLLAGSVAAAPGGEPVTPNERHMSFRRQVMLMKPITRFNTLITEPINRDLQVRAARLEPPGTLWASDATSPPLNALRFSCT